MGQYINPPESVRLHGRALRSSDKYADLAAQLQPGELLFGLFDRGIFKSAPYLFSASEFQEFYRQYVSEAFLSADYFALAENAARVQGIRP